MNLLSIYVNILTRASFALRNNERDEVAKYQSGRYISSSEAVWRILSFPIHERHPPVMHLDIHAEGSQSIYFNPENVAERLVNPRRTTLIAFFELCGTDSFAKTLLYDEIPAYYTYDKQRRVFNRRRRGSPVDGAPGVYKEHVVGRVILYIQTILNVFICAYYYIQCVDQHHLLTYEKLTIFYILLTKQLAKLDTYSKMISIGTML